MQGSTKDHWDQKYTDSPITKLGWYEPESTPSLQLIENCAISKNSPLIDIGSGASTLISNLLALGYQNICAADISRVALDKAKTQLPEEQGKLVRWVVDDITNPSSINQLPKVTLWHDRAVFHFLTDEQDRQTYHSLVEKMVIPGGFIVIATFALNGASACSGLPVQRYSVEMLAEFFGNSYTLIDSFDHTYTMPSGDLRPYVYACFQKSDHGK